MKDRKIVLALSKLSLIELNSFTKFMHSPYFNVNVHLTDLYLMIFEHIKNQDIQNQHPQNFWSVIFPNTPYQNQKFLKMTSDLTDLLEQFLAQKEFDASMSLKSQLKLEGVRKRNLEPLYNSIIGETERLQNIEINQSSEFYLQKYQIEKNIFSLKTENEKKNEKFEINSTLNIKDIADNLDYFYIAEKLRLYCTLLSWKKMYKLASDIQNTDDVIKLAKIAPYKDVPTISLYYKIYLTYIDENDVTNYYSIRESMKKNLHYFPIDEQREIYSTILGYCINKINKNQTDFFRETFEVYRDGLQDNILIVDGNISVTTFRNISIAALRVEEFNWAENFIIDYAKYVDEKYRNNAVEFSLARLEFYKKNFSKVLIHLFRVSYEDVWYNLNAKTLQIASYYELDEYDALESLLQAFKMYIQREKSLTSDRKTHYLHLIKYTSALVRINPKDKKKIKKLKDEIDNTKGIVSKPWLIEKVNELLK